MAATSPKNENMNEIIFKKFHTIRKFFKKEPNSPRLTNSQSVVSQLSFDLNKRNIIDDYSVNDLDG